MLPEEKRRQIAALAPTIAADYENYNPETGITFISKKGNTQGAGGYDWHIKQARGNHLAALIEEWLNSANLFGQEHKFLDILHLVGLDNVTYRDPNYRQEAVYPVFLNIRNPFDTTNIPDTIFNALKRSAIAAQRHFDPQNAYDADAWDKTSISPMEWIEQLQENINDGSTTAWTNIPDFVSNRLKSLGFDGIKDTGGKYHPDFKHTVYIPFGSRQIKSAERNNGQYSSSMDIYRQSIGEKGAKGIDNANGNSALIDRLSMAQNMQTKGMKPRTIKRSTGWEMGIDGKWRYELQDGQLQNPQGKQSLTLDEFYVNEALYNAYPNLRNYTVAFDIPHDLFSKPPVPYNPQPGQFDRKKHVLHLQEIYRNYFKYIDNLPENDYRHGEINEIKAWLVSQIQRVIQSTEGFTPSRQASWFAWKPRTVQRLDDDGNFYPYTVTRSPAIAHSRTAGEVETRNMATRSNLTPQQRQNSLLADTEDTDRKEQLIVQRKNKSTALEQFANDLLDTDGNNFLTPEKFEQLVYHGTDNIILGNRFDLSFAGSSEGGAAFGYGAYFAENHDVSESYRHYGDLNYGKYGVTVTTKKGKTFSTSDKSLQFAISPEQHAIMYVLFSLQDKIQEKSNTDIQILFQDILEKNINGYRDVIRQHRKTLAQLKQKNTTQEDIKSTQEIIKDFMSMLKALKSLEGATLSTTPPRKGNLYVFDIPENDVLMDWDASMAKQPDNVKAARKAIIKELKANGLNVSKLQKARTGGIFYFALAETLSDYNMGEITDRKQKASFMLNKYGVPGHRFLDRGSRDAGEGTHNFVIWNTDMITMLGVEGNTEATEYFRNTALQKLTGNPNETYRQSASTEGRDFSGSARTADSFLTDEAKEQIEAVRRQYKGTSMWLKAPNGKKSNLNELQWLLVRTPNFKAWFGDWENDRPNASKIRDRNGEPLVVYHGTLKSKRFKVFKTSPEGAHFGTREAALDRIAYSLGYHGRNDEYFDYSSAGKLMPCFLNIRKPLRQGDSNDWITDIRDAKKSGYDGIIYNNAVKDKGSWSFVIFKPNQTKSATRNNGQYSSSMDIYKQSANSNNDSNIARSVDSILTTEARRQVKIVQAKYQDTAQWLKAPNGKNTNLDELQWLLVRTDNFKAWFGDWENDRDNASKILDSNGEPLIVWHGNSVDNSFSVFDKRKIRNHHGERIKGFFFAPNARRDSLAGYYGKGLERPFFLNIRNPIFTAPDNMRYILNDAYKLHDGIVSIADYDLPTFDYFNYRTKSRQQEQIRKGDIIEIIAFERGQIKSADGNNGDYSSNPDVYRQSTHDEQTFYGIDADGRQLMLRFNPPEIDEVLQKYKGTGKLFKAPNGKKSKLDKRLWLVVRTDSFKKWFGDWENDPQNSSKVLDENGEPLLVTHQTYSEPFSVFNTSSRFAIDSYKTKGTGAWFADLKDAKPVFSDNLEGSHIYHVFLNIRNPFIYDAEGREWNDIGKIWIADENGGNPIYYDNDGKPFLYDYQAREYIRTVLHSDPRYYYEHDRKFQTTDDLVRAVRKGKLGNGRHDGVIIRNVGDLGYYNIDDYVIFKPVQVKSKNNRGSFGTDTGDMYKQSATNTDRDNPNATRTADSFLTPDAKRQVEALRKKYRGTALWLKAPNGENTNLDELQWLLVRTDNFKHWFGDWEHDPQNSSQAVDKNGEPLVLYFGAHNDYYTVLDPRKSFLGKGLFTSNRFDVSETYTREDGERRRHSKVYPLFLNLRNPYIMDAQGKGATQLGDIWLHDNETGQDIFRKKDEEPYFGKTFDNDEDAADYIDEELDGNFDRYYIEATKYQVTDDYVKGVYDGDFDGENTRDIPFDGIIFRNIRDAATDDIGDDLGDVFVFFNKHQAKSSDRNNGEYSSNPDIYKQSATDRDMDRRYFDALNSGDMDTARAIVDEQSRRKGYSADNSHRMQHQPPTSQDGYPNLANVLNSDFVPANYWTHPQYYLYSPEEWDAFYAVTYAIRNKKLITVYRAVPKDVKETALRNGDWVTPSRDYAVQHGESSLDGNYRIISAKVSAKYLWWDGNSIAELGYDDGKDYVYRNTKNSRKLNNTVVSEPRWDEEKHAFVRDENGQIVYDTVPPSKRFNYRRQETYYQSVPQRSLIETFPTTETETAFNNAQIPQEQQSTLEGLKRSLADIMHGFKGDFPELAGQEAKAKGLAKAREILRSMNRKTGAKAHEALMSFHSSLHDLNQRQFDIFTRIMLINDIYTFKRNNPNAPLPLGFTPETLKASKDKFVALAQRDKAIILAINSEYSINERIRKELATLADELGLKSAAERVRRNDFFLLDYASMLAGKNINANYIHAVGLHRTSMLQDIERLKALRDLRDEYDKKRSLENFFGSQWRLHIPTTHTLFNPMAGEFIHSARSITENVLGLALEQAGKQLGLSDDTMKKLRAKVAGSENDALMVLPKELANTLNKLSVPVQRSPINKFLKQITTGWKKYTLYFLTRFAKYNTRNFTGDLDAVLAGNPRALKFMPKSMIELWDAFFGDVDAVTPELKEFQTRGGAVTTESAQELADYKQFREFNNLISDLRGKEASAWKDLPRRAWALIDKFAWSGVQKVSEYREQILRYATYLSYLEQMQNNNGIPLNWGASDRDEVLSIPDIRDRAFKMANELLGAYDQVSETGKFLRDILFPFYSWIEVNAKRYVQLIKNAITEDMAGDVVMGLLKGKVLNAPYYAYKIGKAYIMINLFSMLIQLFNRLFWPEDEDKLPPDVQERPHITLGHDSKGNVLYFDKVGNVVDNLEWFAGDTFRSDMKDILNGKLTFTDWVKKVTAAPFNKAFNALTPLIKMPMEMATGRTIYPDITRPRPIRDNLKYIAQSFGLSWPYKVLTDEPRNDWQEFRNLFIYSQDADEAAYFYTLDLVRQFQERVLGRRNDGFNQTERGKALQKLKAALRLGDMDAAKRYLQQYYRLGGKTQGFKTSMLNMNPLHSLSKNDQRRFLRWISDEDRKYVERADKYFRSIAGKFLR